MSPLDYTATLVPVGLLISAGIAHLRHFGDLRKDLAEQGILPEPYLFQAGAATIVLELGLGVPGLVLWALGFQSAVARLLLAVCILYAVFAVYSAFLLIRRPWASCGCSPHFVRVNVTVPGRAVFLAILAAVGVWHPATLEALDSAEALLLSFLPPISIGLLLSLLPAAVGLPSSFVTGMSETVMGS